MSNSHRRPTLPHLLLRALLPVCVLLAGLWPVGAQPARADHTTDPGSVTVVGDLQSEAGCGGDWDPACAVTHLVYDMDDEAWQGTFTLPAGGYEYKAALNDAWDENYGQHAAPNGGNIALSVGDGAAVKFYYSHDTHWIADNVNSVIAVAPGSFQSELGCPGDWDPTCLRSWLQDPDGDGLYEFETTALPAGSYEAKVAINESWDENYGAGGAFNGPNIGFTVPTDNAVMTFRYDATTHLLTIQPPGGAHDNNVMWDGLRHDSRDLLYRTPGGAVPAGTPVTLRLRTFHNDVTDVRLRVYDLNAAAQQLVPMRVAASDVDCYGAAPEGFTCDFWEATLPNAAANNLWYRFIVSDGSDTDYYSDNTPALDGGPGAVAVSADAIDRSWALMVHTPGFEAPAWASNAVIYQIFPDRFRNGRSSNDAATGDVRYDDPVLALPWNTLPEGYCRNYANADGNSCPWRFDATPPEWSLDGKETPRGRDYMGGDLKGVDQQLDYLQALGVTVIYFNPIFDAGSNHSYDTQDYFRIDPYFGTQKDWDNLVKHANERGIRIVVDNVFNHMSSDSPLFDRYGHYPTLGACESADSPYRSWFVFRAPAGNEPSVCAPSTPGGNDTYYDGWFGFDSIPVINKSNPEVQAYFINGPNDVASHWLEQGASGWRLDVMGDASFPNGYWETFRDTVKTIKPEAVIIGELWQKDSTLLRGLRGDRADTTMNYRLRDAVLGLLAPQAFDSKGFADSGYVIAPSQFLARLESVREDYPDAAYYSLMNLLDSHDTERLLWTLTPGAETQAAREQDAANVAAGKQRVRLASLIQFTVPGAPTVYYGDEVGLTGDDDPDDRRTYPWADRGGSPDTGLLEHYQTLAAVRESHAVLTQGDFRGLLADDGAGTVAYGRQTEAQAAIVAINRSEEVRTLTIPVAGYLPDGVSFSAVYGVGNDPGGSVTVSGGNLVVTLNPLSGLLLATGAVDLAPPAAPAGLRVTAEGDGSVGLAWDSVPGASGYNLYRSPVSGGGWVRVNASPLAGTSFTDTGLRNGQDYYYVAAAVDSAGNESGPSNEANALPHLTIGWANLQWPPSMVHTVSTTDRTDDVYGQVWIGGATEAAGPAAGLRAQLGFGPDGSNPNSNDAWTWVEASFNTQAGSNDEFVASLLPEAVGSYDYAYRYSTTNGRDWVYAGLGGINDPYSAEQAGDLTVSASGDTTAPVAPTGLTVVSGSPAGIELVWEAVAGDPTLHGYEVRRSEAAGGPYTTVGAVTANSFVDTAVNEGATYYYVVRAVDTSFNRSAHSNEAAGTAALRKVSVVFTVEAPDTAGRAVYIAGTLNRLDGGLPEWNPGGVVLAQVDATHWTITLTGDEGTQIEYKYALGSWDFVEKDGACGEIGNRPLTLSYGGDGTQAVNDTVLNWRNVAPCGN